MNGSKNVLINKDSIDKDSLDKDSIDKDSIDKDSLAFVKTTISHEVTEISKISKEVEITIPKDKETNRCLKCNKRLGTLNFKCRCGDHFCEKHRYSNTHECNFDWKSFERERLEKLNPQVIADKLNKI